MEMNGNKQNVKMAFIVLHYMAVEITIECISHILKNIDTECYKIIVVDNHSPDNSYQVLQKKYDGNCFVHLIHNHENYGFTKGNNIGITYALEHFDCDFITVLNNDAFLLETAFVNKIDRYYKEFLFAVAGPRIIDRYGKVSNPVDDKLPEIARIHRIIADAEKRLKLNTLHLMMIYNRYKEYKSRLYKAICLLRGESKKIPVVNNIRKNVVLHGSFWVFSRKYFAYFSGLPDKRGMFAEEETLLFHVLKKKLLTVYLPDILVVHLEDASTDMAYKIEKEKWLFIYQKRIETWKEYLELVNKETNRIDEK